MVFMLIIFAENESGCLSDEDYWIICLVVCDSVSVKEEIFYQEKLFTVIDIGQLRRNGL